MSDSNIERYPVTDEQTEIMQGIATDLIDSFAEWLSFFDSRFYSVGFTLAFFHVFATPADTKSSLALFLENIAKVSRSTAERMIKEAEDAGHLVVKDKVGSRGKAVFLSDALYNHCVDYLGRRSQAISENPDFIDMIDKITK